MSGILIFASIVVTLIVTVYLYVQNVFSYWKRRGVPFKEPSFPFGNFPNTFLSKMGVGEELRDLYNDTTEPYIGVFTTIIPALLVRDPKMIKDVFIKDFQSFNNRGWNGNAEVDPMADNLLLQTGDRWKHIRMQTTPAFTSEKLKAMFDVILNCGKSLDKYVEQFGNSGEPIEICDTFARYTSNVIMSVAFGIDIDCIENRNEEFRNYGSRFFQGSLKNMLRLNISLMTPRLAKFLGLRFVDKDVGDFMIDTVRQNLEYRESNNISRKDFFQMMMQLRNTGKIQEEDDWTAKSDSNNKKSLTLEEIAAHTHLFFIGGYETTATTMSFMMYALAKHPEIQQQAYEEITNILDRHDGKLTYDSIADMKYVGYCLDETFRMYPAFPYIQRKCTKTYKIPDSDVVIEEGITLMFSVLGLQYDPNYYNEPEKFKPERYSDLQRAERTFVKMPFLAFGEGPRNCIGMKMGKFQSKLAIISLLQKFRFELSEEHKNTELKLNPLTLSLSPVGGIKLKVFIR